MFESGLFINFSATKRFDECTYELKYSVRRAIEATLDYEDFPWDVDVAVTFCDNEYIQKLNREFRNKDSATDVLSFPMCDFDNDEDVPFNPDGSLSLGDIVISIERAREQAKEIGHSTLEEIVFLAVHSTLHLLGYDHERSKDDDEAQCLAQREIIENLIEND
jgi:probable rRNA maturation factor